MPKPTQITITADEQSVRSMAMVVRLPIIADWPDILKVIGRVTGTSVRVISHTDISDELACVAVVYAAHVELARAVPGIERQIAERMPSVLTQGPGSAFIRLPCYWKVAEDATAAGLNLAATLTGSYLEWLDGFVAGKPGTATVDPLREMLRQVVEVLLTASVQAWGLESVAQLNTMIRRSEEQWPELRRH